METLGVSACRSAFSSHFHRAFSTTVSFLSGLISAFSVGLSYGFSCPFSGGNGY